MNKEKIISKCSLKLDDSKNIYFSMHIFNIFPFIRRFLTRITKKLINFLLKKISNSGGYINFYIPFKLRLNITIKFQAYCLLGLKTLHVSTKNAANYGMSIITTGWAGNWKNNGWRTSTPWFHVQYKKGYFIDFTQNGENNMLKVYIFETV